MVGFLQYSDITVTLVTLLSQCLSILILAPSWHCSDQLAVTQYENVETMYSLQNWPYCFVLQSLAMGTVWFEPALFQSGKKGQLSL